MRKRINEAHMRNGVRSLIQQHIYRIRCKLARYIIYPGTIITGQTVIGEDCLIGPHTEIRLRNRDSTDIRQSVAIIVILVHEVKLVLLLIFVHIGYS